MASSQMCGLCTRKGKLATAVNFCTDCGDTLCSDCVTNHKAIKELALHYLIGEKVQVDKAFIIKKICSDHPDMSLEFYCSNHESLCCRTCSVNTHRTCGKILPLDVAASGIKSSVMLNDVTADLQALLRTAEKLEEDRALNKENIEKSEATTLQQIAKFKRELIQELDELEMKLITSVDATKNMLIKKAESDILKIEGQRKGFVDISEQLEFLTKHGSESQILMLLNTIRVDISKQENEFQYSIPFYDCSDINFRASGIKSVLHSLGSVEIKYVPCSIEHKPSKHTQAQLEPIYDKNLTKFKFKNKFYVPYRNGRISSIFVKNDKSLLLCYTGNKDKALSIWSETGDNIQNCSLAGTAWGIAFIPGTNEAVVTLPVIHSIQFVNIANMVPGKVMQVPSSSYGVTVIKDTIVLGGEGKVHFLTMAGNFNKTVNVGYTTLFSLKTNETNMIYCCDANDNKIHFIDINKDVIHSNSSSLFNGPVDMALDGKKNLFMSTNGSNSLHRLSSDGNIIDILLKKEDELDEPWAVAFNRNYTKLYIANGHFDGTKYILIFDCA